MTGPKPDDLAVILSDVQQTDRGRGPGQTSPALAVQAGLARDKMSGSGCAWIRLCVDPVVGESVGRAFGGHAEQAAGGGEEAYPREPPPDMLDHRVDEEGAHHVERGDEPDR